ncbi:MAG: hypothetical protein EOO44_22050 [Flavobacterium sp.]|nr:MAG: hypothetical protein EOO44_22050 [Flavobacterium sp.]
MKRFFLLIFIMLLCSCHLNNIYENEEAEKAAAEKVADEFYNFIKRQEFVQSEVLFSSGFYKISSREDLQILLNATNKLVGNYQSRKLIDWKTKRIEGSNPSSEYFLVYEVIYDKYPSRDTFRLVKEDGEIKIFAYNVNSEGFIR